MTKVHGFVLVPEAKEAEKIRQELSVFSSDPDNTWREIDPHITLLLCSFSAISKIEKAKQVVQAYSEQLRPLKVRFGNPIALGDEYVELPIVESEQLIDYHQELIEKIKNVSRECFNPKYLKYDLSSKEKDYLHEYGYFRIKEYYGADMTIAKFVSREIRDKKLLRAPVLRGEYLFNIFKFDESTEGSSEVAKVLFEKNLGS